MSEKTENYGLLEFLSENIPHLRAVLVFDSSKGLVASNILEKTNKELEMVQFIIKYPGFFIQFAKTSKTQFSKLSIILLQNDILAIRPIKHDKILFVLLSKKILQEPQVLENNYFIN